jgi:hypothetical protein
MTNKQMEKLVEILYTMETAIHARVAFDIADVIEANNLNNPDNIVFDREVARSVLIQEKSKLHRMLKDLKVELMEGH